MNKNTLAIIALVAALASGVAFGLFDKTRAKFTGARQNVTSLFNPRKRAGYNFGRLAKERKTRHDEQLEGLRLDDESLKDKKFNTNEEKIRYRAKWYNLWNNRTMSPGWTKQSQNQ